MRCDHERDGFRKAPSEVSVWLHGVHWISSHFHACYVQHHFSSTAQSPAILTKHALVSLASSFLGPWRTTDFLAIHGYPTVGWCSAADGVLTMVCWLCCAGATRSSGPGYTRPAQSNVMASRLPPRPSTREQPLPNWPRRGAPGG